MIQYSEFGYPSADRKTQIHAVMWLPEGEPEAVLQIVHGMQEYIERYDEFARYMCAHGVAVVGNDHLGHGGSIVSEDCFGYFAEQGGNKCLLLDMRELQRITRERFPEVPYFMLGHSMGSFLARQYICQYGKGLDGAVISGTAWYSAAEAQFGMLLCRLIARRKGWMYRSPLVTKLSTGGYNKRFEPARTKSDWLTRDENIVDAYRRDRRTQFTFTLNGYYNMFACLKALTDKRELRRVPKDLPVLFIAGEMDPVGGFGAGVKRAAVSLGAAGVRGITCRLYPHDRHEVLNELNRQEVYEDILRWMRPRM